MIIFIKLWNKKHKNINILKYFLNHLFYWIIYTSPTQYHFHNQSHYSYTHLYLLHSSSHLNYYIVTSLSLFLMSYRIVVDKNCQIFDVSVAVVVVCNWQHMSLHRKVCCRLHNHRSFVFTFVSCFLYCHFVFHTCVPFSPISCVDGWSYSIVMDFIFCCCRLCFYTLSDLGLEYRRFKITAHMADRT